MLLPIDEFYLFQGLTLVFKCIYCSHLVPSLYINYSVANSDVYNNTIEVESKFIFNQYKNFLWAEMY